MRNYDKPLTFVLTGSDASKPEHSRTLLEDFIFGNLPGDAQVDVKFVVPYTGRISASLSAAIDILKEWGIDGEDFIPVVEPNNGHKSISSAAKSIQCDSGTSLEVAVDFLYQAHKEDRNVAFIALFDPENDLDVVTYAKDWNWLPTLNLSEGLIDHFEGYESAEDRAYREAIQAEYQAKMAEAEPEKPARKTAAKKATTPRKRAASKPLESEDVPLTEDAVKAPTAPAKPKPAAGLIADAVKREEEKKAARTKPTSIEEFEQAVLSGEIGGPVSTELSGTIVVGKSELPENLEPVRKDGDSWEEIKDGYVYGYQMINGEIQSTGSMGLHSELSHVPADMATPDVWKDVAAAVPADTTHITVSIDDMVKLSAGMKKMAEGFTEIISAYSQMLEDK